MVACAPRYRYPTLAYPDTTRRRYQHALSTGLPFCLRLAPEAAPIFISFLTSAVFGVTISHHPRAAESPSPLVLTTWLIPADHNLLRLLLRHDRSVCRSHMRCNQIVINEIRRIIFEFETRQIKKEKNENKHCHFYLFLNCKNK